jgi:hypothetical protein
MMKPRKVNTPVNDFVAFNHCLEHRTIAIVENAVADVKFGLSHV